MDSRRTRAVLEQVIEAIRKAIKERHFDVYALFERFDADGDGYLDYKEMQQLFEWMRLGFSPKDVYEVVQLIDVDRKGYVI
jgi:Ca2+-binding EF-hand superfamily protein